MKSLAKLARHHRTWTTIFTAPRLAAAAAIFVIASAGLALLLNNMPVMRLSKEVAWSDVATKYEVVTQSNERDFDDYLGHSEFPADAPSRGKQTTEITFTAGSAYDPMIRGPGVVDSGTVINGEISNDGSLFAKAKEEIGGIADAQTSSPQGYAYLPQKPDSAEKWGSGSSFEGKLHGGTALREGLYFYNAPEAQSQVSTSSGTVMNDENYYAKNKIGGITGGQQFFFHGYDYSSPKTGPIDKLTWDSKPHSGIREGGGESGSYVGGGYGGMGGYGGGIYSYSGPGGKGGDGRDGGNGVMSGERLFAGSYDGDIDFGSKEINWFRANPDDPAVVADGMAVGGRVDFQNGIATGITTDGSTVNIIDSSFDVVSNDGAPSTVTVDVGRPFAFTKPDAPGVDTGGIPVGGSEFYNGKVTITDMDFKGSGLNSRIDSFGAYIDKNGDRRPVVIDEIKPVTVTEPELTPAPHPARPSQTMKDLYGISEPPGIKLHTESGESHIAAEDTKITDTSFKNLWRVEARSQSEAVVKKSDEELVDMGYHHVPEKAKPVEPPVPGFPGSNLVEQGQRQGEVSRETDEAEIPYSAVTSGTDSERYIADFLRSSDKTKSLLKKGQSTDDVSTAPVDGPADKEESRRRRVPILGDIPLVGGLFRSDPTKRPLTEEEKKQIVAYIKTRKFQPEGEPVEAEYDIINLRYVEPSVVEALAEDGFRDLPGGQFSPKVLIEPTRQKGQIIVYGRKDQREAVKKMVQEIDIPRPQVLLDVNLVTTVRTGEDEPDLPPASRFKLVPVNPWVMSERDPLSTFALDVDTASYTLCRRYIRGGFLPPAGAVRMEEFVNYFNYQYPQRTNPTFKVHAEAAPSPFARTDQNLTLLKIGVKARTIGRDQRKAAHLIFVVDASASMGQPDRLPLVQQALGLLVNKLSAVDRVSLITCASEARLHLETVPARERDRIRQAINAIQPAGSTNLLAGLKLGYATARRSFAPKQINHVVLCSDGVANVGQTEAEAVLEEVAEDRKQGITITCVGVGYGSYNDAFMEALANRGDGSYMFLDSARQAHRVFVRQLAATLQTVARDARIQVDFNPNRVRRYRLIGYENRDIEDKRFRDDTIDAGEVGSGQCSTALYELELIGQSSADQQDDLGTVFVRYRDVGTGQIEEISSRLG
ncbi:MAG: von Willebrand factor type A domain-containing protein, partial [candidate division Zixibacteria bacterium]|nr:von Willebrand factor type A domain-containing protein [candidate division Zixibacteria bacterium]